LWNKRFLTLCLPKFFATFRMKDRRLFIANRGEIAVRIIQAARELGFFTILPVAEDDFVSVAAQEADLACPLEGENLSKTYLSIPKLVQLARENRADLVHPGYGFLSENKDFAQAVIDAGMEWVGPPPKAMELLSSKVRAKELCQKLKIPTVPFVTFPKEVSAKELEKAAEEIGFPLLVKASGGGGGRGMRKVFEEKEFAEAVHSAQREAQTAFGDPTVFVERLVSPARHIEVQVMGDKNSKLVALGERDCSIQRRHQKIIEETPSPLLSEVQRKYLEDYSIRLLQEAGYISAGTVEFIFDSKGQPYFLEVNTRLQVEHPITEERYGIDIVQWQLRIALGESLWLGDLHPKGAAIEARLYAENPYQGFTPQPGRIYELSFPRIKGIRIETGVGASGFISPNYDPLIAKIIAWAPSREEAIRKLVTALRETVIVGPTTNRDFLIAVLQHPKFAEGDYHTHFVHEEFDGAGLNWPEERLAQVLAAAFGSSAVVAAGNSAAQKAGSVFGELQLGREYL